ncbi:hypothetical protein ET445_10425 [Agromyces protaetiae]|uniref:Uncharacterized protein n=1 Tax=Agromyces protaetiae TaxID=2509455 RepID=A0A4P6FGT7_9MICO|nr:hypothetical protein [Agromyces protaetiae]QAY73699.1 hypothetical protein ET445_10425 [Agromyces protaetiae]
MAEQKKKVVRVEQTKPAEGGAVDTAEPTWTPTPEAKQQALRFRLIALGLWILAIAGEAVAIFWVLRQPEVNLWILIGLIVVIGALALTGSFLWKKANRLDPAKKSDTVRFFVQNQLGAIIAVIAFLPLIILIFTNKNMDGKQKAIAGIIAIVIAGGVTAASVDYNPPSVEQYSEESNIVAQLTGEDLVFWTKSGKVFHVCEEVPDVNKESQDGTIYSGTVADAHAAGKDRLVSYWDREAINYCGFTQEQVDAVKAGIEAPATDAPAEEEAPEETPAAE